MHDDGLARAVRRPHDKRDVALVTVAGVQPEQVGPLGPAAGRHGQRGLPLREHRAGRGGKRRLVLAPTPDLAGSPHQASLGAAVPADPERRDLERRPGGRHVQVELLAGQDAHLAGVAFDGIGGPGGADPEIRVARQVTLRHRPGAGTARSAGRGFRTRRGSRCAASRRTGHRNHADRRRSTQETAALQSFARHPRLVLAIAAGSPDNTPADRCRTGGRYTSVRGKLITLRGTHFPAFGFSLPI